MIDEAANCLDDGEMNKPTKRGYLEISSRDNDGVIAEEGMQDADHAVSGSDKRVQIKRTKIGNSFRHIVFDMTDEIPNLSSLNGVGVTYPVDTCVKLNLASQNNLGEGATTKEKEKEKETSLETEADAIGEGLSDSNLGEQIKQHPEKSYRTGDGPNLTSEEILTGNGPNNIIEEKCSPDELANNMTKQVQAKRKKLLILDINGLLADILSSIPKDYKSDINIARRASEQIFAWALLSYQCCHLPHVLLIHFLLQFSGDLFARNSLDSVLRHLKWEYGHLEPSTLSS